MWMLGSHLHRPSSWGKRKNTKYSWAGGPWQFLLDLPMIYDFNCKFSPCIQQGLGVQQCKKSHMWETQATEQAGEVPGQSFPAAQGVPAHRNHPQWHWRSRETPECCRAAARSLAQGRRRNLGVWISIRCPRRSGIAPGPFPQPSRCETGQQSCSFMFSYLLIKSELSSANTEIRGAMPG